MIHLAPQPGETQAAFCERCHQAMEQSIPETDRRNSVCLQMCRDAGFDVPHKFSAQDFHIVQDVPVFTEHTTHDKKGNLVVYDKNALAAIAERCNKRIRDRGTYSPITDGHTPTKEEIAQGAKMPEVLGYSGNYRLGMIGNEEPVWAIFSDEYQHIEDRDKLRKLRRRSPEVWLEDRMNDRFFDPIAALGAETPRLDMGMARFSRTPDGRKVERYSAYELDIDNYTASFPGAMTGFIPGGDDKKNHQSEGSSMQATPEIVDEILNALMQTEPFQFLIQQMQGGGAPPAGDAPEMGGVPPAAPPAAPPMPNGDGKPPMMNGNGGEKPPYQPDDEDKDAFSRYMAGDMSDEEMNQYMCGKKGKYQAGDGVDEEEEEMTDSYQKDNDRQKDRIEKARYEKQNERIKTLEEKLNAAEAEREKAERYSRAKELSFEVAFDVEKFIERTAKYSKEQFEDALDFITEHGNRVPMAGTNVPSLYVPADRNLNDQEKTARYSKRAVEICTLAANQGKHISSEEAFIQAKKEIDVA